MNYNKYIAPMAVVLALSTGCGKLGCGKDEQPTRVRCVPCLQDNVKPEHNIGLKNNTYVTPQGVQYVIQLPPGYRAISVVPNGRVTNNGALPPKDPHLSGNNPFDGLSRHTEPEGSSYEFMPNPYTACTGAGTIDPCYDSNASPEERGRACAARLPTADDVFGPENMPSLEERLRECERLNHDLERQLDDAITPRHGRG